jgi:hypothetical protein
MECVFAAHLLEYRFVGGAGLAALSEGVRCPPQKQHLLT